MADKPFAKANLTTFLAADVTNTGTVTVAYPSGQNQASLLGTTGGVVMIANNMKYPQAASGAGTFAVTFGSSNITITNNSGETWAAGSSLHASFGAFDYADSLAGIAGASLTSLATTAGVSSDTIADVGASFSQTAINNAIASLAGKINAVIAAGKNNGLV